MKRQKQSFVESDMLSPEAKRIKDARAADKLSCEAKMIEEARAACSNIVRGRGIANGRGGK